MSANIITFEGQYMADQMRNIDKAKQLTEEAMSIIKKANQHRTWKCKEVAELNDGLEIISNRISRLNSGIVRTGIALGKGLVSVRELEQRSETQSNTLSSNLQNSYGFSASSRNTDSTAVLPLTLVPPFTCGQITVKALIEWFKQLQENIKKAWENFAAKRNSDNSNTSTQPTSTPSPAPAPTPQPSTSTTDPKQKPAPTPSTTQYSGTAKENIYNFLYEKIGNKYGVAALMGNLNAESGLSPNNLQNSYERSIGLNDNDYTAAVDNGSYGNFVHDSAGYGIAQWTYYTRKQALLDFAREKGTSVGDLQTQLEFLWKELSESYPGVLNTLRNASSVREASDVVLKQFERPADQSESACAYRASLGESLYSELMA